MKDLTKNVSDHVTGEEAQTLLKSLKCYQRDKLEREKETTRKRELAGEQIIVNLAQLTGKSEAHILRIIGRIAGLNEDLDWPRIAGLIQSFFVNDQQLDEEVKLKQTIIPDYQEE